MSVITGHEQLAAQPPDPGAMPEAPAEARLHLAEQEPRRDTIVIVGANGANARHMDRSIGVLAKKHPVYGFEHVLPTDEAFPLAPENVFLTNTPEGTRRAEELMESGDVHAVYLSVVPKLHEKMILTYLDYVRRDKLDMIVVPKPTVPDMKSRREINIALRETRRVVRERMLSRGAAEEEITTYLDSIVVGHEHYPKKDGFKAVHEALAQEEVIDKLGRLERVEITITEARTAEDEGRLDAFADGARQDFFPHLASVGFDALDAINRTGKFTIARPDMPTDVRRYRYQGSQLSEGVETAFTARGTTEIADHARDDATSQLEYVLRCGKGLQDEKLARFVFVDPDTEERRVLEVNFQANTITAPENVRHYFPSDEAFDDNGYGAVVSDGLTGLNGGPKNSFQHWSQGNIVVWAMNELANRARLAEEAGITRLIEYRPHMSIEQVERLGKLTVAA